jgi:hypothetical protein
MPKIFFASSAVMLRRSAVRWEAFKNFKSFLSAFHVVLAWVLLGLFLSSALKGAISDEMKMWALGPYHPNLYNFSMPEQDLTNLWAAGHLARLGHLDWLYSPAQFQGWKVNLFGSDLLKNDWIYPPTIILIGVPLSYLPLPTAFWLWDLLTFVLALALLRYARLPWSVIGFGLLGPATWRSLILGQYGVFTGALVVAGLVLSEKHPIKAGIFLGLSTIKPQQGIIAPAAWLGAAYWRAILAAAATFGVMACLVTIWFGPQSWILFLGEGRATAKAILEAHPPTAYMNTGTSVFWMLRTMGCGIYLAYGAQLVIAMIAFVIVYRVWHRPDNELMAKVAMTVCCSLLITPYGFTSDMVSYSIAVAIIVRNNFWRLRLIDVILWLWPFYCTFTTVHIGLLLTPVFVVTAAMLAWFQMKQPRTLSKQVFEVGVSA